MTRVYVLLTANVQCEVSFNESNAPIQVLYITAAFRREYSVSIYFFNTVEISRAKLPVANIFCSMKERAGFQTTNGRLEINLEFFCQFLLEASFSFIEV